MKLFARFRKNKRTRDLECVQANLEGKRSPFPDGAPEKAQPAAGGAETLFVP